MPDNAVNQIANLREIKDKEGLADFGRATAVFSCGESDVNVDDAVDVQGDDFEGEDRACCMCIRGATILVIRSGGIGVVGLEG